MKITSPICATGLPLHTRRKSTKQIQKCYFHWEVPASPFFVVILFMAFLFSDRSPLLAQWVKLKSSDAIVRCVAIEDTTIFIGIPPFIPDTSSARGVFRSTDNGMNWSKVNNGLTDLSVVSLAIKNKILLAGTLNSGIFRSTDNGETWTNPVGSYEISSFAVSDTNVFATANPVGVLCSSNDCTRWTLDSNGLGGSGSLIDIIVSGTNLFVATGMGVFRSTDNGNSWVFVFTNDMKWNVVDALASIGTNILAAAGGGTLFRSTDEGSSWSTAGTGLPYHITSSFAVESSSVFMGCDITQTGGIYFSADTGQSWSLVDGLPSSNVWSLAVTDQYLFAGTTDGLWREGLSDVATSVGEGHRLPSRFNLMQCYPNPFNPSATIRYDIPTSSWITLKVYDALGREVSTLVNGWNEPGQHSATWNAERNPSGIYFYRLSAGTFIDVKKMVLVK